MPVIPESQPPEEEFEEDEEEEFDEDEDEEQPEFEDDDDEIFIDDEPIEEFMDLGHILGSVLTTEDGETVCTALVNISKQIEMQNRIMIKILAQLQKNA